MIKASRFFSIIITLSVMVGLSAAPAFGGMAAVKAQEPQPTPTAAPAEPPPASPPSAGAGGVPAPTAAPTEAAPTEAPPAEDAGGVPVVPLVGANSADAIPDQYIVVYKAGADSPLIVHAGADRMTSIGGNVSHIFSSALHGFSARLSPEALAELRHDPRIAYIELDQKVSINDGLYANRLYTTSQSPADWGLDRIDARVGLDGHYYYDYTGTGVNVYVIDTGIRTTHTDFGGRATMEVDEVEGSSDSNYLVDCNGHGTHVSGTIGGTQYGVAKGVTLHGVKVLDCGGSGSDSSVIAGIDWVTAHHVSPSVANMSLGTLSGVSTAENTAVQNSIASGVTYAVAAGNSNADACKFSPSSAPNAITVGATMNTDARSGFSNFGKCLDIFAPGGEDYPNDTTPGYGITSDWNTNDTATNTISGTSMASPHVAGAAALYLEVHPSGTPAQVAAALIADSTLGVVTNPGSGSPNRLLFSFEFPAAPALTSPPNASFTNNTPLLTWGSVPHGDIYQVQIAAASTFASIQQDSGWIGSTSYTSPSLPQGLHYWRVRAQPTIPAYDVGPWSLVRTFTVDTLLPGAPVLSSPANGASVSGTPLFKWGSVSTANAYQFEYATDCGFGGSVVFTSGPLLTTMYTPPAIAVGGPYCWHARARDAALNWGPWSTVPFSVTIQLPLVPAVPVLISPASASFINDNTPTLTWNSVPYADKYRVQLANNTAFTGAQDQEVTDLFYLATSLSPDGKYYWRVMAHNTNAWGSWSAPRYFTLDTQPPLPPVLSSPVNNAVVRGTPQFKWTASTGANAYKFVYGPNGDCSSPAYFTPGDGDPGTPLTTTSYTPPAIPLGDYYWCVEARDAAGSWSTTWSAAFLVKIRAPIPAAPVLISPATASGTDDLTPTLTWGSVPYAQTYEVEMSTSSIFTGVPGYTGITLTHMDTFTLAPGKWYWHVRARNANSSPYSPEAGPWSASGYFTVYPSFDSEFNSDRTDWSDEAGAAWTSNANDISTAGVDPVIDHTGWCGEDPCYNAYTSSVSHAGGNFTDFTYVARVKMDFGSTPDTWINSVGLIVRGMPTPPSDSYNDWNSGYIFRIGQVYGPDYGHLGLYNVVKVVNGTWTSLTNGKFWYSPNIHFYDWNVVKVVAVGTSLKLYVNGVLIFSKSDSSLHSGQLGIETWRSGVATTHVDYAKAGGPQDATTLSSVSTAQVETPTLSFLVASDAPPGRGRLIPILTRTPRY